MEGRPYEVVPSNASLAARSDQFIEEAQGSARRADRLGPMTAILVGLIGLVALGTVLVVAVGESVSTRRRKALAWLALFSLATLPSTLLVQLIPGGIAGFVPYLLVVAASAAVIATAAWYLPRPYGPMLGMLAFMLGLILIDAMTGSHLHYNAVFGYSPTANSRLYGISNYSFGVVITSTILLATFIIVFARTEYAFALAMALLGFVLVVEGLPAWGSDVGGVLAGVPTFLLFVLLVRQRKIRARTLVLAIGATALAIAIFAGIDLMRPADERAHLGRLVERVERGRVRTAVRDRRAEVRRRVARVDAFAVGAGDPHRHRARGRTRPGRPEAADGVAREDPAAQRSVGHDLRRRVAGERAERLRRDRRWPRVLHALGRARLRGAGSDMNASTPAAVSTRIRVFVGCFLGIVVLFGAVGFEAWPLTAFRLFSVARDDTRTSWEARTVDADGRETAFDQQDLPLGYRLAEWPLTEFPSSSDATRAEVCRGIARGARDAGREVERRARVPGPRAHPPRDGEWVIDSEPELYYECEQP